MPKAQAPYAWARGLGRRTLQFFAMGALGESKSFAIRARELFDRSSVEWLRATDIVMASNPTDQDLRALASEGSAARRR